MKIPTGQGIYSPVLTGSSWEQGNSQILLSSVVQLPDVLTVLLAVSFLHISALILLLLLITRKQKHSGKTLIVITHVAKMSYQQILRLSHSFHYFIKNHRSTGDTSYYFITNYLYLWLVLLVDSGIIFKLRKEKKYPTSMRRFIKLRVKLLYFRQK